MRYCTAGVFRRIIRATILPLFAIPAVGAQAGQRAPGIEVYGLTGVYFHGNVGPQQWRPQGERASWRR